MTDGDSDMSLKDKLFQAVVEGADADLRRAIEHCSDINIKIFDGKTALMFAALRGHVKCVQLLINAGADLEIMDESGNTALEFAVVGGEVECVQALIDAGANINASQGAALYSAIYTALGDWQPESLRRLIKAGGKLDCENRRGETPAMSAMAWCNLDALQMLIEAGAPLPSLDYCCGRLVRDGENELSGDVLGTHARGCFLLVLRAHLRRIGSRDSTAILSMIEACMSPTISCFGSAPPPAI